jgi:hypothetical protein
VLELEFTAQDVAFTRFAFERYWELALAPYWPRMLTLVEGDVLHRARRLAGGGAQELFNDLDPAVTWDTDTLYAGHRHVSGSRALAGRGLLLVPSVFVWPRVFSVVLPPWQPTLRYPPRGIATLWERHEHNPPEALAAVLGRSRAALLAELDAPASTTDLARRTGLSAGGSPSTSPRCVRPGWSAPTAPDGSSCTPRTSVAEALFSGPASRSS